MNLPYRVQKFWLRTEGHRLIIKPIPSSSLLSLLTTLPDITDNFPDIDEGLLVLDDITL
jgi:antitoxin VapB